MVGKGTGESAKTPPSCPAGSGEAMNGSGDHSASGIRQEQGKAGEGGALFQFISALLTWDQSLSLSGLSSPTCKTKELDRISNLEKERSRPSRVGGRGAC